MAAAESTQAPNATLLAWDGPDPRRVDTAVVRLRERSLSALGSSTCGDYLLTYELDTVDGWLTSKLAVDLRGDGWHRTLDLRRTGDGWTARWDGDAVDGFELPDLAGAVDCDLGLCPLTNTMPVLRAGLLTADRPDPQSFVMAWVEVPSLRIHRSEQAYDWIAGVDGGGAQIGFTSDDFRAVIEFDAAGLVLSYPGIAHRR